MAAAIPITKVKKNKTSNTFQNSAYGPAAKPQIVQASVPKQKHSHRASLKNSGIHPLRFALKVASSLALFVGAFIGVAIWFELDNDLLLYFAVTSLAVVAIYMVLAQAALLYGFAKKFDGNPAPHRLWWAAARSGFMDIVNVNLISLIVAVIAVGIDVTAWSFLNAQEGVNSVAMGSLLGLLNVAILWVLLGAYVAKRLAVPAVAVGGMTAVQALRIGWRFYVKAGGHLVAAALEVAVVRVFAIVVVGLLIYGGFSIDWGSTSMNAALGGAFVAAGISFLAVMTLLELEMRIWQRQYRQWTSMLPAALRFRLITGRVKPQP